MERTVSRERSALKILLGQNIMASKLAQNVHGLVANSSGRGNQPTEYASC